MTELSGVEPLASDADCKAAKQLLGETERSLERVEAPELRRDLLDIAAMYRAAIEGYEAATRPDPL